MRRAVAEARAEQLDRAVVERQHAVVLGLGPPELDHRGELLGLVGREVVALRAVVGDVVQLPLVVVERHAGDVAGDRLPAVGVDAAVAHHLEVLHLLRRSARRARR